MRNQRNPQPFKKKYAYNFQNDAVEQANYNPFDTPVKSKFEIDYSKNT